MDELKRFRATLLGSGSGDVFAPHYAAVVDVPKKDYAKMQQHEREAHQIVRIRLGGMMSERLAATYVRQIADQLNQFDIANAAVAKLT